MFLLDEILNFIRMSLLPYHAGEVVIVFQERVVILEIRGNMVKFRRLKDSVVGICPIDWIDEKPQKDNVA